MSYEQVVTDNQRAKQELNELYLNQTGSKAKVSVIKFFQRSALPFGFFSMAFSAFGFYFDLIDGFGVIGAVILGVFLGAVLELSKHFFTKGAFANFGFIARVLLGGGAFIFTSVAMAYHYKSLITFENISVRDSLKTQVAKEYDFKNRQLSAIESTQLNNKELTTVFGNGTRHDDKSATKSIESNNELAIQLAKMKANTTTADALLKQEEKTASQNKNTLLLLFMTMELFSLFGWISKGLVNGETSEPVKNIIKTSERLATLEENVLKVVETGMINNTMAKIEQSVNNSPTPPPPATQNNYNQAQNSQIGHKFNNDYKMPANPYISHTGGNYLPSAYNANNSVPKIEAKPEIDSDASSPCTSENDNLKENLNETKKKVLDLMKYNYQDSQIILASWDNGAIEEGGKLVKKSLVLAELEDQGIKEDDYVSLFRRLKKQKLVRFDMGYFSLCELHNLTTTKIVE